MPLTTTRDSDTEQLEGDLGPLLNIYPLVSQNTRKKIIDEVTEFNSHAMAQQFGSRLGHESYYKKSIARSLQSTSRLEEHLSPDDKLVLRIYGKYGLYFNHGLRTKLGSGSDSESHAKSLLDYTLENYSHQKNVGVSELDKLIGRKFIPKVGGPLIKTKEDKEQAIKERKRLVDINKIQNARITELGAEFAKFDFYVVNSTSLLLDQIIERNAEHFESGNVLFRVSRAKRDVFDGRVELGGILYERGFTSTSPDAESVLLRYSHKEFGGEGSTHEQTAIPRDEEEVLFVILNNGRVAGIDISGYKFTKENNPISSGEFLLNRNSRFRLLATTVPISDTRRIVVVSTLAHQSISRDAPVYDIFNGSRSISGEIDDSISNFRARGARNRYSEARTVGSFENRIRPPTDLRQLAEQFETAEQLEKDAAAHSSASGTDQNSEFEKSVVADQIQNQADSLLRASSGNSEVATGGLSSETSAISSELPSANPGALQTSETSALSEASAQAEALEGEIEAVSELAVL